MLGEIILVLLIVAIVSVLPHGVFKKYDVDEQAKKEILSPQQLQRSVRNNKKQTSNAEIASAEQSVQMTQDSINELGEDIASILQQYL